MDVIGSMKLDKNSSAPLYRQVADNIMQAVESGDITAGDKLPSIRRLALSLEINSVTAVNAYKYLENKSVITSHVGRGTFVSYKADAAAGNINEYGFDFNTALNFAKSTVSAEFFPASAFKDAFAKVLDRDLGAAFSYVEDKGYLPLRKEICADLLKYRIRAGLDDVHIISGTAQSADIISSAIINSGDAVVMESPASYTAAGAFRSKGARILTVTMEKDGMDMDKLELLLKTAPVKLIYISTYFQTPTGYCCCEPKKQRLIELSAKYGVYIAEEDSCSDFAYSPEAIRPLKAFDKSDRVIFIKTYGKAALPGPGMGALLMPEGLKGPRSGLGAAPESFMQRAFELFLASGEYMKYMESMRLIFKARCEKAGRAVGSVLSSHVECEPPRGGFSLWLKLRNEGLSVEVLSQELLKENVIITPGALYDMENRDIPYFRLSLADINKEDIEAGIDKIKNCIEKLIRSD